MNDPSAEDVLKKTFEHLEDVLKEQNHKNQNGTGDRVEESDSKRNKDENSISESAQEEV